VGGIKMTKEDFPRFKKTLLLTEDRETSHHASASCAHHEHTKIDENIPTSIRPQEDKLQTFRIEGMDCSSCAETIVRHLRKKSNVHYVELQFSTAKLLIDYDGKTEEIIEQVNQIGYRAIHQRKGEKIEVVESSTGKQRLIISGMSLLFGFIGSITNVEPLITTFLYVICIILSGIRPARSAWFALKSRSLDMNVLMSFAVIGAAVIGEWLEGATVVWLFALGNELQSMSIEKTRRSIRQLMELTPLQAWVIRDGTTTRTMVEEVNVGDQIVVKPGESIPLDGTVVEGLSTVNQAPITGESIPVLKSTGNPVYAGTINQEGILTISVSKNAENSTVARMVEIVEQSQGQRAPMQAWIDRFASVYTPIVFLVALFVMFILPLFSSESWQASFYQGLELLVIACPCALVISTPVAIISAIGSAAKNGVLIKGGLVLEKLADLQVIAFDKTGTMTQGKPIVQRVVTVNGTESDLFAITNTIEKQATHPLASAIVEYVEKRQAGHLYAQDFVMTVGKGAQATINGVIYYIGSETWLQELGIHLEAHKTLIQTLREEGFTIVLVGSNLELLGIFALADPIRPNAADTIKLLHQSGITETIMLTGDHELAAKRIAAQAGVTNVISGLMPEEKMHWIEKWQASGKQVAMIGDGINDAPALAKANLGIAMGGAGTDLAIETADVVLMADDLSAVAPSVRLSKHTRSIIRQNITFSLLVKIAASLLLIPGWLTLWMAVLSDTGAAILVVLNSLRLLRTFRKAG